MGTIYVVLFCYASCLVFGAPNPNPDPKPAIDTKPDNLNPALAAAALENLPAILEDFRKGNPIVEHVSNTYDAVMDLYDKLDGADAFKDRNRPLELTVINGLKKKLRFKNEYFNSGTFYVHPKPLDIPPGGVSPLFVTNRQAALTGVTGGLEYEIVGTGKSLVIGFTNPLTGGYKNFIDVGAGLTAQYAYENSHDDKVKREPKGEFEISATKEKPKEGASMRFEYTIVPQGTLFDKKGKAKKSKD